MWILKWLGIALLLIVMLGFSMMNIGQQVDINLFFWQFEEVPLILVIFETFISSIPRTSMHMTPWSAQVSIWRSRSGPISSAKALMVITRLLPWLGSVLVRRPGAAGPSTRHPTAAAQRLQGDGQPGPGQSHLNAPSNGYPASWRNPKHEARNLPAGRQVLNKSKTQMTQCPKAARCRFYVDAASRRVSVMLSKDAVDAEQSPPRAK